MALVNCTECGKEVSDKAVSCPHCGCPDFVPECTNDVGVMYAKKFAKMEAELAAEKAKRAAEFAAEEAKRAAKEEEDRKNEEMWARINRRRCPFCGSTEHVPQKKGYSGKKGFFGTALFGGIGALAGTIGSDKMGYSCLSCGKWFGADK